jgi:hypothetical protein
LIRAIRLFFTRAGHGGVFKTGDNGVSFDPIFDKQPTLSIGAIAGAPSDSDVIWVGSGEANDRLHSIRTNRFSFRSRRSKSLSRELSPPTAWDFLFHIGGIKQKCIARAPTLKGMANAREIIYTGYSIFWRFRGGYSRGEAQRYCSILFAKRKPDKALHWRGIPPRNRTSLVTAYITEPPMRAILNKFPLGESIRPLSQVWQREGRTSSARSPTIPVGAEVRRQTGW